MKKFAMPLLAYNLFTCVFVLILSLYGFVGMKVLMVCNMFSRLRARAFLQSTVATG